MNTKVIVLYAQKDPVKGVKNPGPHQTYRFPEIRIQNRELNNLDSEEIRIQMIYAGLCGTDVHVIEADQDSGYICSSVPINIPGTGRIIGHEGVGRIVSTGSRVIDFKIGDYVTFESIMVCHACDVCRQGNYNQCLNAKLLGMEMDGLFGTFVDIPWLLAHNVTDIIKDESSLKAMACVEPAGVAYNACQNARVKHGDSVVIFGAGPIGLLSAMLCRLPFGASSVFVVEPLEFRRKMAERYCDKAFSINDFFNNCPDCIDVVIEASGCLENINKLFLNVNANGRIVLLGRSGDVFKLDSIDHMITNKISITGSRGPLEGAVTAVIKLYENGILPIDEIVTGIIQKPEDIINVLSSPDRLVENNCKVLIRFNREDEV